MLRLMKKILSTALILIMTLCLIQGSGVLAATPENRNVEEKPMNLKEDFGGSCSDCEKSSEGSKESSRISDDPGPTEAQLQAQISLFKEALDLFSATSPQQAAEIWASAWGKRNGAMQYAVYCSELKKQMEKELGDATNSLWVIGTSSPWLTKYEIINNKKVNENTYMITVRLHWATSSGESKPSENTLTVVGDKGKWCIKSVK